MASIGTSVAAAIDFQRLAADYEQTLQQASQSDVWKAYRIAVAELKKAYFNYVSPNAVVSFGPGVYRQFFHYPYALEEAEKKFASWSQYQAVDIEFSVDPLETIAQFEEAYRRYCDDALSQEARLAKKKFKLEVLKFFLKNGSPNDLVRQLGSLERSIEKIYYWYEIKCLPAHGKKSCASQPAEQKSVG